MRWCVVALLASSTLWAADEQQLALERRAQADFDRVEMAATPSLSDTEACLQSQAAWLAVAPATGWARVHYRKGYCTLAGAAITRSPAAFQEAAGQFDWAGGAGLLAALARLNANAGDEAELRQAVAQPGCQCEAALEAARQWLGWMELARGNLVGAAREFQATPAAGWQHYVAGRQAFDRRQYREAMSDYRTAIDAWDQERRRQAPGLFDRLKPRPEVGDALVRLGGAELLAGDAAAAVATLDRALKTDDSTARAYYLRARAHELESRTDLALADYNLASRAAFASARDLASGEAHLYRGILFYRRQDFSRAENEFSSALNFNIAPDMQADAVAWRHLAAVAAGACQASREALGRALGTVSPYFPSQEAVSRMNACPAS